MVLTAGVESLRAGQADAIALKVSTRARYLRPGEVVLLTAVPLRPLAALRGEAFGRGVGFWQTGKAGRWQGLAAFRRTLNPALIGSR
jgi:hypothetical protein